MVKLLADKGANLTLGDKMGYTPLHLAVLKGNSWILNDFFFLQFQVTFTRFNRFEGLR